MEIVYGGIGAAIFSIYLIIDTQVKRGMVMMENLTHVENWNLKKRPKLVGIKKLWLVWDDI